MEFEEIKKACCLCEDREAIRSVIQYLFILIDEQGITEREWMKRLHILQFLINSHFQEFQVGVTLLLSVYETFHFRLQSTFIHSPLAISDVLLRTCLQDTGFEVS